MPQYELKYFNARGRAEISRLVLAAGGIKYKDVRYEMAEWPKHKASTPFGVLPNLSIDGKSTIVMSPAIANYLARELGLYGANNAESNRIDTVTCAVADVMDAMYAVVFAKEDKPKAEANERFTKKVDGYVVGLESLLKENASGDGYFVGKKLTLADIAFFASFSEVQNLKADALGKAPKLKALMSRVAANANIAKWLKERPATPF